MLNQSDILGGHDIARIIGNFGPYWYKDTSDHLLTSLSSGDESCFVGHGLCFVAPRHDLCSKMDRTSPRRLLPPQISHRSAAQD